MSNFQVNVVGNLATFPHEYVRDKFKIKGQTLYGQGAYDHSWTAIDRGHPNYSDVIGDIYDTRRNGVVRTYRIQTSKEKPREPDVTILNRDEFFDVFPEYRVRKWWKTGYWNWKTQSRPKHSVVRQFRLHNER